MNNLTLFKKFYIRKMTFVRYYSRTRKIKNNIIKQKH